MLSIPKELALAALLLDTYRDDKRSFAVFLC